jgi:hypothetical protein
MKCPLGVGCNTSGFPAVSESVRISALAPGMFPVSSGGMRPAGESIRFRAIARPEPPHSIEV